MSATSSGQSYVQLLASGGDERCVSGQEEMKTREGDHLQETNSFSESPSVMRYNRQDTYVHSELSEIRVELSGESKGGGNTTHHPSDDGVEVL